MEQRRPTRSDADTLIVPPDCMPLGIASRGFCGRIHAIQVSDGTSGLPAIELERRLLELGFIEGADVTVLHEGPVGRDPLAVRVNGTTIALRRREAMAIFVIPSGQLV
jgi:ferrous iron transport protein A